MCSTRQGCRCYVGGLPLGVVVVDQIAQNQESEQNRRTTRIVQSVPVTVTGVDALGQPFHEHTSTLIINCHGCKYQSKHYVLKNTWVTLEVAHPEAGRSPRRVRAKILWIQRPRTVQELFQVGAELETIGNFWGIAFPPEDWFPYPEPESPAAPAQPAAVAPPAAIAAPPTVAAPPTAPPAAETPRVVGRPTARGGLKEESHGPVAALPPIAPPPAPVAEPPRPSGPVVESISTAAMQQQMNRLLADARKQLETAAREAVAAAAAAETGQLLRDLNAQLARAAERTLEDIAGPATEKWVSRAAQDFEKTKAELANAAFADWSSRAEAAGLAATQQMLERLQQVHEQIQKDILENGVALATRQLNGRVNDAGAQIDARASEASARVSEAAVVSWEKLQTAGLEIQGRADSAIRETAQWVEATTRQSSALLAEIEQRVTSLQSEIQAQSQGAAGKLTELRAQLDQTASQVQADWATRLHAQTEEGIVRLGVLHVEAGKVNERLASIARKTLADWQAKLGASVGDAEKRFGERLEASLGYATDALGGRMAEMYQNAATIAEQGMADRVAEVRRTFEETGTEVRQAAGELRASLEQDLARAQASITELESASARIEEMLGRMKSAGDAATEELDRRFESILAGHAKELQQHGESLIGEMAEKMKPAFGEAAQQASERVLSNIGNELEPQIARINETLGRLYAGEALAEQHLRALPEQMQAASERYVRETVDGLRTLAEQMKGEFATATRTSLEEFLTDMDSKATDASHVAFEGLYKAAEWYQKKAQTSMQSALEKAMEQTATSLRDKAAEMSRMFTTELDHYSRSFTEHTQGMLDDRAKELLNRTHGQLGQTADTQAARFGDEIHKTAQEKLSAFDSESRALVERVAAESRAAAEQSASDARAALEQSASQMAARTAETTSDLEARAAAALAHSDAHLAESLEEFQQRLALRVEERVSDAQQEFQTSLLPILDSWRIERESLQQDWRSEIQKQSNESVESYKERLQNVSNSWMVASVTALNQHSQTLVNSLASGAEQRLREACAQAFRGLADTIRDRMTNLSLEFQTGFKQPPGPGEEPPI